MRYYNLYSPTVRIGSSGTYTIESTWSLQSELASPDPRSLEAEFRQWAGSVGDSFRIPAANAQNGASFSYDDTLKVSQIAVKVTGERSGIVEYTAVQLPVHPVSEKAFEEKTDVSGIITRSGCWKVAKTQLSAYLPAVGALLNWDGGSFVCTERETLDSGNGEVLFSIAAREVSTLVLGNVQSRVDADQSEYKTQKVFLAASALAAYQTANTPGSAATAWAGSSYYLESIDFQPCGKIGYTATLNARKIVTRMVSEARTESFYGYDDSLGIRRVIKYVSRWFVASGDIGDFLNLSGTIPVNWANSNCLISEIVPKKRSPQEYEVSITAEDVGNPDLFKGHDDNSNLAGRTDISVNMGQFFISAEMAGYFLNEEGFYEAIDDWDAALLCPFVTGSALPENMINATVWTLLISETVYHSGRASGKITEMAEWAQTRIYTNSVATKPGPYLKVSQKCDEVFDNRGRRFTKLKRVYERAPGNYSWNASYWANH